MAKINARVDTSTLWVQHTTAGADIDLRYAMEPGQLVLPRAIEFRSEGDYVMVFTNYAGDDYNSTCSASPGTIRPGCPHKCKSTTASDLVFIAIY